MSNPQLLPDLKARLDAFGIAPVQLGRMRDTPDHVIALNTYPGDPSRDHTSDGLPVLESHNVQVMIRASARDGIAGAETLAYRAYRAIVGRHLLLPNPTTGPRRYDWIRAPRVPAYVGHDQNDRPIVTFDLEIQRWGDVTPPEPEPEP